MPIGNVTVTRVEIKNNGSLRIHYGKTLYKNGAPTSLETGKLPIPIVKKEYEQVLETFEIESLEGKQVYFISGFGCAKRKCPGGIMMGNKRVWLHTHVFCPYHNCCGKGCFHF